MWWINAVCHIFPFEGPIQREATARRIRPALQEPIGADFRGVSGLNHT